MKDRTGLKINRQGTRQGNPKICLELLLYMSPDVKKVKNVNLVPAGFLIFGQKTRKILFFVMVHSNVIPKISVFNSTFYCTKLKTIPKY